MVKTTIYLSEELKTYVENRARETGASEAEVIRTAIVLLSEAEPITRKRPRSIGAGASDNVHGRNFDEWLAANWERDW
jgi:Arc/MetJ-type ribon-helix-helix transcriptional regulator